MSNPSKPENDPPSPVVVAAVALPLLVVVIFLGQHGSMVGRLLVGLAAAVIAIIGTFMARIPGASFLALDGDASFRRGKVTQVVVASLVTGLCSFILAIPIAVAAGIIAAAVAGQFGGDEGAESTGD